MRMKFRAAVAILAASALLTSCSSGSQPSQPKDTLDKGKGVAVDSPKVTLIDAGHAPLSKLEYHDTSSGNQSVKATVTTGFNQIVGKPGISAMPEPGTGQSTDMQLTGSTKQAPAPQQGQRDATRSTEYRLDNGDATGFRAGWRGDNTGAMSSVAYSAPQGATDQQRSDTEQRWNTLLSLPVVFPTQDIGQGGSWKIDSTAGSFLQTTTYTVSRIDGNSVTLDVAVQQRPALGALSLDGTPGADKLPDQELKVTSSQTFSRGSLTVDLQHALPTSGDVLYTTRVIYGDPSATSIVQDTTTGMKFS